MDVQIKAPTREELLARCRNAASKARKKGTPPARPSAKQRKQAAEAAQAVVGGAGGAGGNMSEEQLRTLAQYEKDLFETCNGDAAAFCRMKGVDESAIPIIQKAIDQVKRGVPINETLQNTIASMTKTGR